ncbi:MAG TPA: DUF4229 domain-containing protein [Streptosporangiaceae bacterium]|jgi:hypothetical protein
MRNAMFYTVSRLLLFIVVLLVLDLAGARGLLLIALALLISGLLSYVLLSRQRNSMASSLSGRLGARTRRGPSFRERLNEGTRAEDTDDEPAQTSPAQASPAKASPTQPSPAPASPPSASDRA